MYGMPLSPQDPIASYEVTTDHLLRNQRPGTRGFVMSPDMLAIGDVASNSGLVLQSKWVRPKVGAITAQFGALGPNAPLALFENGIPATLASSQGYQLAARFPGLRGNQMSLTVNFPSPYPPAGAVTPLVIKAVPPGQIVVTLGTTGTGQNTDPTVTTTAAELVEALTTNPGISRWVMAWVSDAAVATPLEPLPLTHFTGGKDVPYLVYVSINAATTATEVMNLLKGGRLVGATNDGASTGAGVVTAFGQTALTGGRLSAGAILDEDATKLKSYNYDITLGQGIERMSNYGLQVPLSRQAAERTWQVVPTQDRAIVRDMRTTVGGATIIGVNHSMEHAPRSLFL